MFGFPVAAGEKGEAKKASRRVRVQLKIVGKEDPVDWNRGARKCHIEVVPHHIHSPFLAVLFDDFTNLAKRH
jgi:hypothetical protein